MLKKYRIRNTDQVILFKSGLCLAMGSAAGTTTHLGGRLEEFDSHLVGKSAGILRQNHLSGPYDIVAAGNLLSGSVVISGIILFRIRIQAKSEKQK